MVFGLQSVVAVRPATRCSVAVAIRDSQSPQRVSWAEPIEGSGVLAIVTTTGPYAERQRTDADLRARRLRRLAPDEDDRRW